MTAAAEFPFDLAEITRAARSIRSYGVELDDLVSETALGLMQRARSRPEEARRHPARMMRWAAQDALRRLTGSRRSNRLEIVHLGDWELAAPAGGSCPDDDDETDRQRAEWRALTAQERLARIAEADAALGSSPRPGVRVDRVGSSWGQTREARLVRAALRARGPAPRACEACGRPIPPEVPRQARRCSRRCRPPAQLRACGSCGDAIRPPLTTRARYCSGRCAQRASRARARARAVSSRDVASRRARPPRSRERRPRLAR